jgi:hypothetical protein
MSTLSIELDEYSLITDGSYYKEFKEICETSPLVRYIKLVFFQHKVKRLVRRIVRINNHVSKNLYSFSYDTIKSFVGQAGSIVNSLNSQADKCSDCDSEKCRAFMTYKLYVPVTNSFNSVINQINDAFNLEADQFFSDEDLGINNAELVKFKDVWDFDSSEEEERLVFEYNVKLFQNA